ncbi:MAG: energy transducer TonB [Deltaproteobacteria bacterium]|nr:energy transducer TonB [Deltaproteobacteria bacterium]
MLMALFVTALAKDEAEFDMDAPPPSAAAEPAAAAADMDEGRDMDEGQGELLPSQISAVIKKGSWTVQDCVTRYGGSAAQGRMVVSWEITSTGAVANAKTAESNLKNPMLEDCVVAGVKRLKFPAPSGGTVVTSHPFVFN